MTDLEIVRACAMAADLSCYEVSDNEPRHSIRLSGSHSPENEYWPLENDAQAMALVKKFKLNISSWGTGLFTVWDQRGFNERYESNHYNDLNRAICECVSKMQKEKLK